MSVGAEAKLDMKTVSPILHVQVQQSTWTHIRTWGYGEVSIQIISHGGTGLFLTH